MNTHFHPETIEPVRRAIQCAIDTRARVRLWQGDTKTGKAWPEEFDTIGTISRSCGMQRIPILLANSRSMGGPGLLDHCIIGIRIIGGQWLYRHSLLDFGQWEIVPPVSPGFADGVSFNGALHAQFRKPGQALRYVQFMKGERNAK